MNANDTKPAALRTIMVTVFESVPAWKYAEGYDLQVFGFGEFTLAAAVARAAGYVRHFQAQNGRAHRAEFSLVCTTCKAHGIAPGCKRKPCPTCHGRGTLPIPAVPEAA